MSTTPRPNTKVVIGTYLDALLAGDLDRIRSHFADDATWTIHGDLPISGTYRGVDAIMAFLTGAMGGLFAPGSQRFAFTHTYVDGDTAIVEWNVSGIGSTTGLAYDNDYCGVFVVEDGRIREVREYMDTDHARHVLVGSTTEHP